MRIRPGLMIVMLAVATLPAFGANRWYVGAGYGEVDFGYGAGTFDDGSITESAVDDSDSGFKALVGWRASRRAALEVAYVDLGAATFTGTSDGTGADYPAGAVSVEEKPAGLLVEVVDRVPFGRRLGLMVKLGALHWEADVTTVDASGTTKTDEDGTNLVYGVGIDYLLKRLSLRVEWERFTNVIHDDVDLLSAGATFTF